MTSSKKSASRRKRIQLDWDQLREKSLQPGGFAEERVDLWPKLLSVSPPTAKPEEIPLVSAPHDDERQIGLDTDRSFVLYPVESKVDRDTLQKGLHELLVSVFRKRPKLSYFQGYHDIATVFFLTLPEELQLLCVEKISLHRLRDSMGQGLEPVLGLMRVTKNLLQLADPSYAQLLEQVSPMPFYALSNLLTLFAHDMPTLPLIQHVFDYLLCRPPIAVVYLASAIILARKQEVIQLEENDEDGMIHSLLSSLPDLVDDVIDGDVPVKEEDISINTFFTEDGSLNMKDESRGNNELLEPLPLGSVEPRDDLPQSEEPLKILELHEESILTLMTDEPPAATDTTAPTVSPITTKIDVLKAEESSHSPEPHAIPLPEETEEEKQDLLASLLHSQEDWKPEGGRPKRMRLFLTDLLRHADALYEKYPPSHSGLSLSSIMGPQSVVFTWSESTTGLADDDEAEAMIAHPELVVYPHVDADPHDKEGETAQTEKGRHGRGRGRGRRRKLHKSPFGQVEKKTMLAGTVLVLGVAMAVYGMKASRTPGPGGAHAWVMHAFASDGAHGSGSGSGRDWKRVSGWVGGALAGISQKIMDIAAGNA